MIKIVIIYLITQIFWRTKRINFGKNSHELQGHIVAIFLVKIGV
jgi:hypothetical protein